jgi:hypothetical protein
MSCWWCRGCPVKNAIFFNPACSKCRQTRDLLGQRDIDVPVVEYMKEPPDERTPYDERQMGSAQTGL